MALYKSQPTEAELQRDKMLRYEYAMYEMLSSYFKKGRFENKVIHDRILLAFKAVSSTKQADQEDVVLDTIDNFIIPKLKVKNLEDKEVIVTATNRNDGSGEHNLIFKGEGFEFAFWMESKYSKKVNKEVLIIHFLKNV